MFNARRARRSVRVLCCLAFATTALLVCAGAAMAAGTARVAALPEGSQVVFEADNATTVANNLTVTTEAQRVSFVDSADGITAGTGCTGGEAPGVTVTCAGSGIASYTVDSRDGADILSASGSLPGILTGGPGDDTITGGDADETLRGSFGTDTLRGGGGDDVLTEFEPSGSSPSDPGDSYDGGPGDDLLTYLPGDGPRDVLQGGPGIDRIGPDPALGLLLLTQLGGRDAGYPGFTVDLSAGTLVDKDEGEADTLGSVEELEGLGGGDTVNGSAAANDYRSTLPGQDSGEVDAVNLGSGPDVLNVGQGDDQIVSDDGFRDQVRCGAGVDTVAADRFDDLTDCENETRSGTPSVDQETRFIVGIVNPDRTAPVCTLTGPKANLSSAAFLRRGGVSVGLTCDEAITGRVQILTRAKSARGLTTATAGDLVLAERTVSGSGMRTVKLKPSRRLAKALGRRYRVRVVAEVHDSLGNRTAKAKRVTVKVPKKKTKTKNRSASP